MLGWSSVQLGPKDEQGLCDAKLTLLVRAGQPHNCIDDVGSDIIVVSIGEPNKKGRGNCELSGFLRAQLGLAEEQVKLEDNVSKKSKTLFLKRLTCDKRELIWQLQSKVGDKHPTQYAAQEATAARRMADTVAKRLKEEGGEYRRLQEEARAQALSAAAVAPSPYSDKVSGLERPGLPQVLRVRKPNSQQAEDVPVSRASAESPASASVDGCPASNASQTPDEDSSVPNSGTGLQGLCQYDSDESSEEESSSDEEEGHVP